MVAGGLGQGYLLMRQGMAKGSPLFIKIEMKTYPDGYAGRQTKNRTIGIFPF
jgi:hypothetical protein